jgi:2-polyprenyl-3-methyl-5-hydroxy-6-metoxy-1,4-benzoquinol methylase
LDLTEALKEIAEYQKEDFSSVLDKYNKITNKYSGFVKWSNLSADEWNQMQINQNDIQNVMEFYKKTPNYIFELMEYHSTEAKQRLSSTIIDFCKKNNFHDILDFGAGICQDSINASKNNLVATAADIPGKTFDFGKWRIKKHDTVVKTIDIFDETPLNDDYDSITCFEVLQHVVNPEKTLLHLRDHLKSEGILFITTRFRNNYSLALKHNEHLQDTFEGFVKKCDFQIEEKIHMWGKGSSSKFLFLLKKKDD